MSGRTLPPLRLGAVLATALVVTVAPAMPAQDSADVVLDAGLGASHGLLGLGGRGWREAWAARVRLPVLPASRVGGGLEGASREAGEIADVVVARGRADGLAYRMLPAALDPVTPLLPPDARDGSLPSFLRDLVATLHPAAPLVAASLYREAGLPVLERQLGVLPVERGGAGGAAWVERAPELDGRPFLDFRRVVTTDSLLTLAREVPGTRVDLRAYLAARLADVLLGDRKRGPEAWLWGLDDREVWVPIGRSQEQALLRAGSSSRWLLGMYQPGFVSFGAVTPHTQALTVRAWDLDRPWLALLDRPTWDSVAADLARRLDDSAIARAVARLPAAHHALHGEEIAHALRVRRDALPAVVEEFYRLMTRYADLELTGLADTVVARRGADGSLELAVEREGRREALRRFVPSETEEVRVHLGAGADRLRLEGVEARGVGLRVTGGAGPDAVSREGPGASRVVLYDARDGITPESRDAARFVPHATERRLRWDGSGPPAPPDFGVVRSPGAVLGFNGDLGFIVGAGMRWTWRGFDQPNYRQRASISLAYATRPSSLRGTASLERRDVLRNVHLSADVLASGIEVVRFHGFGNGTSDSADAEFYRAVNDEYTGRVMLGISRSPDLELRVGPVVTLRNTDTTGTTSLVAVQDPYGSGDFDVAGVEATFVSRPDRSSFAPGFGVTFMARGQFYPAVLDAEEPFGGVNAELDATWVPRLAGRLIVAARLGGSVLGGKVPFGQASRVGGPRTLRGYAVDRFAGDRGSAYGSLELRSRLLRFRLGIAPGDLGILVFGSGGRVWQEGETSDKVHWAGGGGLWVAPTLNWLPGLDQMVGRVEVARSEEGTFFYFGTGFRF